MRADAFATVLMVLGPENGFRWAVERKIAAVFIVRDGDEYGELLTPQFMRSIVDEN